MTEHNHTHDHDHEGHEHITLVDDQGNELMDKKNLAVTTYCFIQLVYQKMKMLSYKPMLMSKMKTAQKAN